MTNLQAIDLLKGLEQSLDDYCELNDEGKTAFRMGITALELFGNAEQLPSAQPDTTTHDSIPAETGKNDGDRTSGDCISRQATINVIKQRLFETAFNNVGVKQNVDETLVDVAENRLKNWFNELPSIQPNHYVEVGKKVLIDRQAALEAIGTIQTYKLFSGDDMILIEKAQVEKELMMLPSIQPEHKTGHWVEIGDEPYDEWECDVCGFVIDGSGCIDPEEYRDIYRFCPNCGANMRGEQND